MVATPQSTRGGRPRRERMHARNELDSLAYQAEQLDQQLQERLPDTRRRAPSMITERPRPSRSPPSTARACGRSGRLQQIAHGYSRRPRTLGTGAGSGAATAGRRRRGRDRPAGRPAGNGESGTARSSLPSSGRSDGRSSPRMSDECTRTVGGRRIRGPETESGRHDGGARQENERLAKEVKTRARLYPCVRSRTSTNYRKRVRSREPQGPGEALGRQSAKIHPVPARRAWTTSLFSASRLEHVEGVPGLRPGGPERDSPV
jgi:hypothetical protein